MSLKENKSLLIASLILTAICFVIELNFSKELALAFFILFSPFIFLIFFSVFFGVLFLANLYAIEKGKKFYFFYFIGACAILLIGLPIGFSFLESYNIFFMSVMLSFFIFSPWHIEYFFSRWIIYVSSILFVLVGSMVCLYYLKLKSKKYRLVIFFALVLIMLSLIIGLSFITKVYVSEQEKMNYDRKFAQDTGNSIKDLDFCKMQSQEVKDSCLNNIALIKNNVLLCKDISDLNLRNACFRVIATHIRDKAICENIKENIIEYENCISGTAVSIEDCEVISNSRSKESCKDFILRYNSPEYVVARQNNIQKNTPEDCLASDKKQECLWSSLSQINTFELCLEFENLEYKDSCIEMVAENNTNIDLCGRLSTDDKKESCMANIAINTGNEAVCEQLTLLKVYCRNQMIMQKAIAGLDLMKCREITGSESNTCVLKVQREIERRQKTGT